MGDADDVVAALEALLRVAFSDRAAGAAASHKQGAVADVGYDASGYTAPLGPDRDVDQDTAAGQGMAT